MDAAKRFFQQALQTVGHAEDASDHGWAPFLSMCNPRDPWQ
jgi:hypothetical protein